MSPTEAGYTIKEIVEEIREDVKELRLRPTSSPDHERRIRRIERWMWALPAGAMAAIFTAVTIIVKATGA
jgi:hypothetical protein